MKNKIVSLLLILVMIMSALSLSSCGSIESKNPARPDDIPYPDTTTIYDLESDVYRTIAETNNVKFEFNVFVTRELVQESLSICGTCWCCCLQTCNNGIGELVGNVCFLHEVP